MHLEYFFIIAISIGLLYVIYTDINYRLIKNNTVITILFLSIVNAFFIHGRVLFLLPAIILLAGMLLNFLGAIGAGDVKLITALSLGMNEVDIINMILFMGLTGIPLSVICIIYYKFFKQRDKITIPYGVAISAGYWCSQFLF